MLYFWKLPVLATALSFIFPVMVGIKPSQAATVYSNDFDDGIVDSEFSPIGTAMLSEVDGFLVVETPSPGDGVLLTLPSDKILWTLWDDFMSLSPTSPIDPGDSATFSFFGSVTVDGILSTYEAEFIATEIEESVEFKGEVRFERGGLVKVVPRAIIKPGEPEKLPEKVQSFKIDVIGSTIFYELGDKIIRKVDPPEINFLNIEELSITVDGFDGIKIGSIAGTDEHAFVPEPSSLLGVLTFGIFCAVRYKRRR